LDGAETVVLAEFPVPGASLPLLARRAIARTVPRPRLVHVRFLIDDAAPEPPDGGTVLVWGTGARSQRAASEALARPDAVLARPPRHLEWPPARTLGRVAARDVGMSEDALDRADQVLRAAVRDSVFPGAALAVGRRGGLVRLSGYGMTSREADAKPVDARSTLYDLASLTKVIAATPAAMALVAQGRLDLDAPVRRYVPEFSGGLKDRVTVRQLLDHTSGLPAGLNLYNTPGSPEDALRRVLSVRLSSAPGEVANYSDLGMVVLAEVVRHAGGVPFDVFVAGAVYAPLGMASTMFLPPLALRDWIAPSALTSEREYLLQGIVHDGTAFRLGGVSGNAGLFATAYDVALLAQSMLARGAYGTTRLFAPALVDSFTAIQPGADTRALGWDTPSERSSAGSFFSARAYGHTGYTGTSVWIDPTRDLFVVLLTNRTYDRASPARILKVRRDVHDAIARAVTDQPLAKRPGAIEDRPPPRRPAPRRRR
ncbi:MAG TPA: serine hydrolase, partial [Longimicrobiaceae bacterium]|nr:serine hydrolase [Longimicrobiaceae bacterium]